MNRHEFNRWWKYHCAAFPSLSSWMANQQEEGEKYNRTLQHWEKALERVPLRDAVKATDAMLSGDADCPTGWTGHPAAIRRYVSTLSGTGPRRIDGQDVFDCHLCRDTGAVTIWHPKVYEQAAVGATIRPMQATVDSCCVACTCPRGSRWMTGNRHSKPMHRFDEQRMVRITGDRDADVMALEAFASLSQAVEGQPNYTPDFDSWNERKDLA